MQSLLIIEDCAEFAGLLALVARKREWFVSITADREEAFELLKTVSYDLIVSDMLLENWHGSEILSLFPSECVCGQPCLLPITATPTEALRLKNHPCTMPVLTKPFSVKFFMALLEKMSLKKDCSGCSLGRLKHPN